MNFYPHHLGDYAKDTRHLSLAEHGAYRLLMDHYYATCAPLPEEIQALYRVCSAVTQVEKLAVKSVVARFFPLKNGVRPHKRIDAEIAIYLERVAVNQNNGKKGGRPPKKKPSGFSVGSQKETQTEPKNNPLQDPITNHQINTPLPPRGKNGSQYSEDFKTFWDNYPKKVGKTAALKAWLKVKDRPLIETVVDAISAHRKSEQWQNPKYIPNPSTWINEGRWDDELPELLQPEWRPSTGL